MSAASLQEPARLRTAICLFVRNEAHDIAEWVIYHSLIGFDGFIIYNNGSDDNTAGVIDRLRRVYDIKLIEWPRPSKFSQLECYDDCLKNFRETYDWIAFIDSDEFIAPVRDGELKTFLTTLPNVNAIALNWSVFGSAGHQRVPPGLTIAEFTRRAAEDFYPNLHTKMIVRPRAAIKVCNPHHISVEGKTCKADGTIVASIDHGVSATLAGFNVCRVNHYFVKSREHWQRKMRRGYREGVRPNEHFEAHDINDVEDLWATRWVERVHQQLTFIERFPLRPMQATDRSLTLDPIRDREAWLSIESQVDDVLFRAPAYATEPGNGLFDPVFYLETYPDVRASGIDPFYHFAHAGFGEGRRPCSAEMLKKHMQT